MFGGYNNFTYICINKQTHKDNEKVYKLRTGKTGYEFIISWQNFYFNEA